ncbi:MAG: hypothetical protein ABI405_07810 [Parafilimonas sp.]
MSGFCINSYIQIFNSYFHKSVYYTYLTPQQKDFANAEEAEKALPKIVFNNLMNIARQELSEMRFAIAANALEE